MLRIADADGVRTLTLDRPARLNALTQALLAELIAALDAAAVDPAVRCLVLTGAGRGFCAGYDLGDKPAEEPRADEVAAIMLRDSRALTLLRHMGKPTIAAIGGPAAGSGLLLAAACDLRIASEGAVFKLAFASAGRCGDPGGAYLLTHLLGPARARELFLLDEKIDAGRALSIGLVTRVVGDKALDAEVAALARRLASGPTGAYAAIKRNLNAAEALGFEESIAAEAPGNARASLSHDGREAGLAFAERRPPVFRGW
ncbi:MULTISPECIES: enoyl-CoA hydratase-related protein [unclassified Sphingomonas]|uniref:enoyl-CoA hydratase-related protein n=1 Tax=unclassified Sphingomonas TaxID=196159 RepID=UPI000700C0BC|nr:MULTISPECIES: enoyl-CoA hydratase-related protein [unclassified Sphingomonas]KQX17611.1 enoyl-CoA hydratase [Sphingomonas sp. Root1294]KQY70537.1 enoyl-CoA hydratase [Sphingomonas sp. Root50]KRB91976.1 enoyl-CoA hydratase [Sphingomonas sp. Root720]